MKHIHTCRCTCGATQSCASQTSCELTHAPPTPLQPLAFTMLSDWPKKDTHKETYLLEYMDSSKPMDLTVELACSSFRGAGHHASRPHSRQKLGVRRTCAVVLYVRQIRTLGMRRLVCIGGVTPAATPGDPGISHETPRVASPAEPCRPTSVGMRHTNASTQRR